MHGLPMTGMDNLELVFPSQGKHEEAENMLQQALEVGKKVLGKEHPDPLQGSYDLAQILNT